MRKYLNAFDRPILGTIIKPKIGLTSMEYAELCYDFWSGGGDFVKNDEPQADQQFAPFEKMVDAVRMAMDKAESLTGQTKVHSFNVSAADFETMLSRAEYVRKVMKPGSYAFLVDGITAGWMAVQTIRRHYPDVFLHFHRAGHGAFTRRENPIGYTVPVLTKFARLAGASGIHTGTAGVGKMSGDPHEDVMAASQALRIKTKGDYFEQLWAQVPEEDGDIKAMVTREELQWGLGARSLAKLREQNKLTMDGLDDVTGWRVVKKMAPIISGGLNPVLLPEFLDIMGTIDFITTMGGGVHSHPMGTHSGIKAMIQAYEAWKEQIPLSEYAKDKEELRVAIDFYDKHGIQAHRTVNPA
jgi:ribulose-bisphosphate carboxylase large chain